MEKLFQVILLGQVLSWSSLLLKMAISELFILLEVLYHICEQKYIKMLVGSKKSYLLAAARPAPHTFVSKQHRQPSAAKVSQVWSGIPSAVRYSNRPLDQPKYTAWLRCKRRRAETIIVAFVWRVSVRQPGAVVGRRLQPPREQQARHHR